MTHSSAANRSKPDELAKFLHRLESGVDGMVSDDVLPTQYPSLDRAIGGGFRRGDLTILGGDAGVGSSSLALGIALRASPRAILLTGECRGARLWERALAISARVPLESLRFGTLTTEESARIKMSSPGLGEWGPVVSTVDEAGVAQVESAMDQTPEASLVVIDGVESLLSRDSEPDAAMAGIMRELKRISLRRNVAIFALAHLSLPDRSRKDLRPRLVDFPGAGAVGTSADVVLGLYREELYDADLAVAGSAELLVLKHREAPRAYADLYFSPADLRFEDILDH